MRKTVWGMTGAGAIWSLLLLWIGAGLELPIFALVPTILTAFLAPGLVAALMVVRVQWRAGATDVTGAVDQQVLEDTVQQLVLALCIWPAAAVVLQGEGPGVIMALGLGFALARIVFWAGAYLSPPVRVFGFAASFYPTLAVACWALWRLVAKLSAV